MADKSKQEDEELDWLMLKLFTAFLTVWAVIAALLYLYFQKNRRRSGREILEQEMQWYGNHMQFDNETSQVL